MRTNYWVVGLIVLTLTGCSSKPIVKTEVVYVNKEVSVPCVKTIPEKPVFILEGTAQLSRVEKARGLLIDRISQKSYIEQLEAVISGCREQN